MLNATWLRDVPLPAILPGTAVVVAIGAASLQSAAINSTVVRLVSTADCHIVFGTNPTATANDTFLPAKTFLKIACLTTDKVSAIQDAAGGSLFITPGQ